MKSSTDLVRVPSTLSFNGHAIRVEGEMACLTDMWKANGSDDSQRPARWREQAATIQFIEFIEETVIAKNDNECFRTVTGGPNQGTFAHWQIALAYAKYLSPAFHAWCNTVVRDHMAGRPAGPMVPTTLAGALRLAAELEDQRVALVTKVEELAPKAETLDRLANAEGLYGIVDLAKMLSTGQNRMFEWLREKRILKQDNTPYQEFAEEHFRLKSRGYTTRDGKWHLTTRTFVTAKGVAYVAKRFVVEGMAQNEGSPDLPKLTGKTASKKGGPA